MMCVCLLLTVSGRYHRGAVIRVAGRWMASIERQIIIDYRRQKLTQKRQSQLTRVSERFLL